MIFKTAEPSPFSKVGQIDEIVARMKNLTDWDFFDSQRDMAAGRLDSLKGGVNDVVPESKYMLLKNRHAKAHNLTTEGGWETECSGLYQAYLEVLNFDKLGSRITPSLFLFIGTILLFWPLVQNVALALMGLLFA